MKLPDKPKFTDPCNHCGECCQEEICPAGKMMKDNDALTCKALYIKDGKAICGLVMIEHEQDIERHISNALGIGCGCSMPDTETTHWQIMEFDKLSMIKMYGNTIAAKCV